MCIFMVRRIASDEPSFDGTARWKKKTARPRGLDASDAPGRRDLLVSMRAMLPVGETSWSQCNRAERLPEPLQQKVPLKKRFLGP